MSSNFRFAVFMTTVISLGLSKLRKEISQEGMERYVKNEKQKMPKEMKVKLYQQRCQLCMEMHPVFYH